MWDDMTWQKLIEVSVAKEHFFFSLDHLFAVVKAFVCVPTIFLQTKFKKKFNLVLKRIFRFVLTFH